MSRKMAETEKSVYEPLSFKIVRFGEDISTDDVIRSSGEGVGTRLDFSKQEDNWF